LELFLFSIVFYFPLYLLIKMDTNIKQILEIIETHTKIIAILIKTTLIISNQQDIKTIKTRIDIIFPKVVEETSMLKIYDQAYLYVSDQYFNIFI